MENKHEMTAEWWLLNCEKKHKEYHNNCPYCDVDAMLAAVRALVEVSKKFNETGWTQRGWEDLLQKQNEAIAAVERLTGSENKEPPPKPQPQT